METGPEVPSWLLSEPCQWRRTQSQQELFSLSPVGSKQVWSPICFKGRRASHVPGLCRALSHLWPCHDPEQGHPNAGISRFMFNIELHAGPCTRSSGHPPPTRLPVFWGKRMRVFREGHPSSERHPLPVCSLPVLCDVLRV